MDFGKARPHHSGHYGTILVVDDEPDYSYALIEILRNDGFEVKCAYTADEALTVIKDVSPDMLLVDIIMPGESGLSLISKLRHTSAWAVTPIIVISGRTSTKDRSAAMEAGADTFLAKPFSRNELRATIWPFFTAALPQPLIPASVPHVA